MMSRTYPFWNTCVSILVTFVCAFGLDDEHASIQVCGLVSLAVADVAYRVVVLGRLDTHSVLVDVERVASAVFLSSWPMLPMVELSNACFGLAHGCYGTVSPTANYVAGHAAILTSVLFRYLLLVMSLAYDGGLLAAIAYTASSTFVVLHNCTLLSNRLHVIATHAGAKDASPSLT